MAKKKSAAERRAQSKRAAERVAAAEPVSAMSAAEADAQALLLAQFNPPQPSTQMPTPPTATTVDREHPDIVLIRQLAEWRRQQALRPPTPPRAHRHNIFTPRPFTSTFIP